MKLSKKELIITIVMIMIILIGLNVSVLAASNTNGGFSNLVVGGNNATTNGVIQVVNENTSPLNTAKNNTANTNTPGQLANTGLEDLPWLVIGACVVSAIFAYKKVKEYKAY